MDSMNVLITRNSTLDASAPLSIYHSYTDLANDTPCVVAKFANANAGGVSNAYISLENSSTNVFFPSCRWLLGVTSDGSFNMQETLTAGTGTEFIFDKFGETTIFGPVPRFTLDNTDTGTTFRILPATHVNFLSSGRETTGSKADFVFTDTDSTQEYLRIASNTGHIGIASAQPRADIDIKSRGFILCPSVSLTQISHNVYLSGTTVYNSAVGGGAELELIGHSGTNGGFRFFVGANGSHNRSATTVATMTQVMSIDSSCVIIGSMTSSNIGKLALFGPDTSQVGPSINHFVAGNDFPIMSEFAYTSNNCGNFYDMYFDGTNWRSSNASSNFGLYKFSNELFTIFDNAKAVGGTITTLRKATGTYSNGHVNN
jgi:hypothetical protein